MRDRDHGEAMKEIYKNDPVFAAFSLQSAISDGTLLDIYLLARHLPCRDKLFEVLAPYGLSFALTDAAFLDNLVEVLASHGSSFALTHADRVALHARLVEVQVL